MVIPELPSVAECYPLKHASKPRSLIIVRHTAHAVVDDWPKRCIATCNVDRLSIFRLATSGCAIESMTSSKVCCAERLYKPTDALAESLLLRHAAVLPRRQSTFGSSSVSITFRHISLYDAETETSWAETLVAETLVEECTKAI